MLKELHIQSYVLIDELTVEFSVGFNVLTGETGAGKSIIVDALLITLGDRASSNIVRNGCKKAVIEAKFALKDSQAIKDILSSADIDFDAELVLSRIIQSDGKSRCFVNDIPVKVEVLQSLGELLVDVHGQHEHQSLLEAATCRKLLDNYAGIETEAQELFSMVSKLKELDSNISSSESDIQSRIREIDTLEYQINEIEEARLQDDEEEALKKERSILTSAEFMSNSAASIYSILYESSSDNPTVYTQVRKTADLLEQMAKIDNSLQEIADELDSGSVVIAEVARTLRNYAENIQSEPNRLNSIEERLLAISKLKAKYGDSIEGVLNCLNNLKSRRDELNNIDTDLEEWQKERKNLLLKISGGCAEISKQRGKFAKKLETEIEKEMQTLGMEGAKFSIKLSKEQSDDGIFLPDSKEKYRLFSFGVDKVDFLVAANPGQEPKSLKLSASGGEISRIMLAIKSVLAKQDVVDTLVFDEIDIGIGGKVADIVGARLKHISENRQVICITHLPQIASKAKSHFNVSKSYSNENTFTEIKLLSKKQITDELVRMLGSETDVKTARKFAKEIKK